MYRIPSRSTNTITTTDDNASHSQEKISSFPVMKVVSLELEKVQEQPQEHCLQISRSRKSLLLLIFCLAQFLDTFNVSSLYTALPTIAARLNMTGGESTWLISAYQLSLASCLLIVCVNINALHGLFVD